MKNILKTGLVHIYTGDGKGKTTAALGQIIRSLGYDMKVYIVQFLKSKNWKSGELNSLSEFKNVTIVRYDQVHPIFDPKINVNDLRASVSNALKEAQNAMLSGDYDIIVLDEINNAVADGFADIKELANFITTKPKNVELILTGRSAAKDIIDLADYVTEMKCIKHPFQKGLSARRGIEF